LNKVYITLKNILGAERVEKKVLPIMWQMFVLGEDTQSDESYLDLSLN
jgi:hypothetical protein